MLLLLMMLMMMRPSQNPCSMATQQIGSLCNFVANQLAARPEERLDARLNTKPGAQPEKRLDARLDTCSLKLSPRSGLTLGWPDRHMAMTLGPIRSGRRGGVAGLTRRRSPVPVKTNVSWSWSRPEVFDISWHACLKLR